jgi:hypothetical protein
MKERRSSCLSMREEGTWRFTVTILGTYERLNTYCPRVTHGGGSPFNAAVDALAAVVYGSLTTRM